MPRLLLLNFAGVATVLVHAAAADPAATPLNQWPMIITHDAGTGYMAGTCSLLHPINNWAMTQPKGPFSMQLDCGARALDLRMYVDKGALIMHHDSVIIQQDFAETLEDIKGWVMRHPGELVLLYTSHCDGSTDDDKTSCGPKVHAAMKTAGIVDLDCSKLAGLTVGSAMDQGRLGPTAGSVVALVGCGVEENYDPTVTCYGDWTAEQRAAEQRAQQREPVMREDSGLALQSNDSQPEDIFWCYGHGADKAFQHLWSSVSSVTDTASPPYAGDGTLWMAQAHWQYDANSVSQGVVHNSCILEDESGSQVNSKLADKIKQGSFKHINLLEVNNVCDGGLELLQALRARVASQSEIIV